MDAATRTIAVLPPIMVPAHERERRQAQYERFADSVWS